MFKREKPLHREIPGVCLPTSLAWLRKLHTHFSIGEGIWGYGGANDLGGTQWAWRTYSALGQSLLGAQNRQWFVNDSPWDQKRGQWCVTSVFRCVDRHQPFFLWCQSIFLLLNKSSKRPAPPPFGGSIRKTVNLGEGPSLHGEGKQRSSDLDSEGVSRPLFPCCFPSPNTSTVKFSTLCIIQ
jgi:hypothetical protein